MRGLRTIALIEAFKGGIVLVAGLGLAGMIHHNVEALAQDFVKHLHLNPARHYPQILLAAAAQATDARLQFLAAGALAYSAIRFVEAYGLWYGRPWAEWFGLVSGGIYLPIEVFELTRGVTVVKLAVIGLNGAVVAQLWRALKETRNVRLPTGDS